VQRIVEAYQHFEAAASLKADEGNRAG
jgi:hypothetical protein